MSLKLIVWKFCHSWFWNTILPKPKMFKQAFRNYRANFAFLKIKLKSASIFQVLKLPYNIKCNSPPCNVSNSMKILIWLCLLSQVLDKLCFSKLINKFFFQNTKNQLPKAASHNHLLSIFRFHPEITHDKFVTNVILTKGVIDLTTNHGKPGR